MGGDAVGRSAAHSMTVSSGKPRLAVIDTDSGFVRVLARRLEAAGWEYRIFSGPVPADELVAMKLNALPSTSLPPEAAWLEP